MTKQQRTILTIVLSLVVVAAAIGGGILAIQGSKATQPPPQAKMPTCPSPIAPPKTVPPPTATPSGAGPGADSTSTAPTPSVRFIEVGAEWCGPCRSMKPIIEELKKQYKGKVEFVLIDVDKDKAAARKYNVSAIPVQLIFQNTKQVFRHTGSIPKADIEAQFKKLGVTPN